MKHRFSHLLQNLPLVAPPAGAWIETSDLTDIIVRFMVAPPAGAWIETLDLIFFGP